MNKRYEKGIRIMREHFGPEVDKYIEAIREVAPEFACVNVEFAFGDLYGNGKLEPRIQELATVAALTVQGFSLPQLRLHIEAALGCGATREEIVEVITQMIAYCGFPAATNAIMAAKEVFKALA